MLTKAAAGSAGIPAKLTPFAGKWQARNLLIAAITGHRNSGVTVGSAMPAMAAAMPAATMAATSVEAPAVEAAAVEAADVTAAASVNGAASVNAAAVAAA